MDFLNVALTSFTTFFATIGPVEAPTGTSAVIVVSESTVKTAAESPKATLCVPIASTLASARSELLDLNRGHWQTCHAEHDLHLCISFNRKTEKTAASRLDRHHQI